VPELGSHGPVRGARGNSRLYRESSRPTGRGDLPGRQFLENRVQPHLKKYSGFPKTQITSIFIAILFQSEGRFANVTDAGRGAVDAAARLTGDANADGEDVWS